MNLQGNLPNFFMAWPSNAILTLIRYRRHNQDRFANSPLNQQGRIWARIAQNINNAHPNFVPTQAQCRNKWNSLKSGYQNLRRLLEGNREDYPVHTPSQHDYEFHDELSDEFWLVECN